MSLNTLLMASRLIAVQAPPPPVYEGPFNIDDALISSRGSNVFTGNWESQTFAENSGSIINVNTAQPVIIENSRFRSRSQHACVRSLIPGSQITVRNCIGETLNPNVAGQAAGYFVKLSEPGTVVVENNTISGSGGVLIVGSVSMLTEVASVRIRYNKLRNIDGRKSDGAGGYVDELSNSTAYFMARQAVQFDKITCADAIIDWNDLIDTPLQSRREDAYNFGNAKGTAGSYILVRNNYIGGGWTAKPFANTYSGAGLLTENASQYIEFRANRVVNASNMAAHMAGGSHYRLIDNRIVSTNKIDGTYVFVANGSCVYSDGSRTYVEATGNRYSWTRAGDLQSGFTIVLGTGSVKTDNVQLAVPATTAMEQAERDLWLADAAAAGVVVGSSLG